MNKKINTLSHKEEKDMIQFRVSDESVTGLDCDDKPIIKQDDYITIIIDNLTYFRKQADVALLTIEEAIELRNALNDAIEGASKTKKLNKVKSMRAQEEVFLNNKSVDDVVKELKALGIVDRHTANNCIEDFIQLHQVIGYTDKDNNKIYLLSIQGRYMLYTYEQREWSLGRLLIMDEGTTEEQARFTYSTYNTFGHKSN